MQPLKFKYSNMTYWVWLKIGYTYNLWQSDRENYYRMEGGNLIFKQTHWDFEVNHH